MKITQSCLIFCDPMDSIESMEFSRPEYWSGYPFPFPGDLPNSGIEPRSSSLQADSLLAEPQGKPKNTGVGSLSLLSGSSWPKNRTRVSSIAGGFFTNWAMREDPRRCLTSGINTISYCYCYVNCSSLGETAWKLWVLQIYIEHLPRARSKYWRESGELSKVCFTGSYIQVV